MLRVLLLVVGVMWLSPAVAFAVTPRVGYYGMHDHRTRGDGWHIELRVGSGTPFLRQLVLHSERCDETVLTTHVRIRAGAAIASSKPFATIDGAQGRWRLDGQWIAPNQLMGTFQITTPTCDGGPRSFTARLGGHARPDDGHQEHHHHGGHTSFGTPIGSYPDLARADDATRARLETLRLETLRAAAQRFPTYEAAVAAGFTRWRRDWRPPLLFHLRHAGYEQDRHRLDPRRPESLVYWWGPDGPPTLVAFMYRMPLNPGWPRFGRPLLGWHAHVADKPGATLMTHVWLTGDLRSAIANCMPAAALAASSPAFRFEPTDHDLTQESVPCLDPPP